MLDLLPPLSSSLSTSSARGARVMFWLAIIDDGSIRTFLIKNGVCRSTHGVIMGF